LIGILPGELKPLLPDAVPQLVRIRLASTQPRKIRNIFIDIFTGFLIPEIVLSHLAGPAMRNKAV
jgi:hypothetical protein